MRERTDGFRSGVFRSRAYLATVMLLASVSPAAAAAVSSVSATLSTVALSATAVRYVVTFTAPSGLVNGDEGNFGAGATAITISGPAGTAFPNTVGAYRIRDVTTGGALQGLCSSCFQPTPIASGTQASINSPIDVTAGHVVEVVVDGVTNGSTNGSISVSTTLDTAGAASLGLLAATTPQALSLVPTTTAIGVGGVQYTVTFTTSATGGLTAGNPLNFGFGASTITLTGPAGTTFPGGIGGRAGYRIRDVTAGGAAVGLCSSCTNPDAAVAAGPSVTIALPIDIPAGHDVELVVCGVTNAGAAGTLTTVTSSDTQAAATMLALVPKQNVTNPFLTVSNNAPGASNVTYTVTFTASSTGGLGGGNPTAGNFGFGASTITITAPAGTLFPAGGDKYTIANLTQGGLFVGLCGNCGNPSPVAINGTAVTIAVPSGLAAGNGVAAGDTVRIVITGVTNPSPLAALTVSTSSDDAAQAPIVAATPTATDMPGTTPTAPTPTRTSTPAAPASTPTATPTPTGNVPLGHFLGYHVKVAKSAPKFFKLGPVRLADPTFDFNADYVVVKPTLLAVPANKNVEGFSDPATHLAAYALKLAKGSKFQPRVDLAFTNQCGEVVLTVKKPTSLLVPSGRNVAQPAPHNVDHFLCYQAKTQKKRANGAAVTPFPKDVQVEVEVANASQARRYDLKKVVSLCVPVAKDGTPELLAGPEKGKTFPLTPATVRNPASFLICYQVKLAKKRIPQNGCGPANPADKGTKITQTKHAPQPGVPVGNQLGGGVLDIKQERLLCIPSVP